MKMKSVLVVDDEPISLRLLAEGLKKSGLLVLEAECGEAALKILKHFAGKAHAIDFLVTDLNMPGMDGLNLIRAARRVLPSLQAILMTGTDLEKAREGSIRLGCAGYLIKPFKLTALLDLLAEPVQGRDQAHEGRRYAVSR